MTDLNNEVPVDEDLDALWEEEEEEEIEPSEPEPSEPEPSEPEPSEPEPVNYEALYQQTQDAYLKSQEHIQVQNGRLKALEQRVNGAPQEAASTPGAQSDEDKFLAQLEQDYDPTVVKAIQIYAKRAAEERVAQFSDSLAGRLAPIEERVEAREQLDHESYIVRAHPDAFAISASPQFDAWIASQPSYIRTACQYTRERGTAEEVIEMLDRYKAEQGTQQPRTATPTPPPVAKTAQAVPRRRGTAGFMPEDTDDNDLEALWKSVELK